MKNLESKRISATMSRNRSLFAMLMILLATLTALVATSVPASADHVGGHDSTSENMTRLKSESVNAFANGIPDIFEMILLAVAISALITVVGLAWKFTRH